MYYAIHMYMNMSVDPPQWKTSRFLLPSRSTKFWPSIEMDDANRLTNQQRENPDGVWCLWKRGSSELAGSCSKGLIVVTKDYEWAAIFMITIPVLTPSNY